MPIALIVNMVRITVTGVLHELVGSRLANLVFHDLAGWLMMPMAMGLLWIELELLARLFLVPAPRVCPPGVRLTCSGTSRDVRKPRGHADVPECQGKSVASAVWDGWVESLLTGWIGLQGDLLE